MIFALDKIILTGAAMLIASCNLIWIWLFNLLDTETSLGFIAGFWVVNFLLSLWILTAITSGRADLEQHHEFQKARHIGDICAAQMNRF